MSEKVGKIEIVIKGGKPWGFNLQTKDENRSIVIVNEIIQGGKADQQGELKKGDHVIKINGIQCLSLADAVQLIESAFRTLTIVVWRTSNFLNKNKYKDYVNIVPQFDEVPYNSDSSYDNPSYSSVYENVQATFQNQKTRNRKFSPLQNTNNSSDKSIFTNSRKAYINSAKVQPEKIDLKNNIRTSNLCINKTFSNESERKASISHNLETKFYSKIPNEVQHCNNVQQIPALDHISDLTCNKSVNLCEVSSQHHVPSLPIQKNVFVANSDFSRHSSKNLLTASKFLMESNCCMYPNCHNKFVNCKIHSPPERDTANPVRQQSRNNTSDYENIEFFSHSNFIQNHDSLNSQQNGNAPELNSLSSCMTDNKILEAEKSVPFKFCDSPLSQSSPHSMIISEEPLSYHIPDSITSSYNNSVEKNRPLYQSQILNFDDSQKTNVLDVSPSLSSETVSSSNIFHNTAVNGLLNHASYESQENYVTGDTFYSFCSTSSTLNEDALTYVNNATFVKEKIYWERGKMFPCSQFVDASNNALCMISKEATVVKLISARQEQTYTDEDEELKEIEKNRNSNTMFFEPVNESPPLPSPPLETEAEILPSNEPLPSPPSFVSEPDIYQKEENGNEFVEAIYANLEMLKIQCSVVNSSSQTNSMPKKNSVEYCKKSCDNAADFSFYEENISPSTTSRFKASRYIFY
ncbi:PDZ domain-containing protein [Caerostris extrusa]|uniref:PDZ domain-containing protein n=1 Tax=Caerostris extrusa TaxID=172846 RepID=A0AAV4VSV7_CAEEX|nr:PDZ domain-containing protein [Caerostris extrusa]